MNHKKGRTAILWAMSLLVLIAGVASGWFVRSQFAQADTEVRVGSTEVSCTDGPWAIGFEAEVASLEELGMRTDAVFTVRILDRSVEADSYRGTNRNFGVHTAEVLRTFKGSTPGPTITIGTVGQCLEAESTYVLFLHKTSDPVAGTDKDDPEKLQIPAQYGVMGLQGEYRVVDGTIQPRTSPGSPTDEAARGLTVEAFSSLLDEMRLSGLR